MAMIYSEEAALFYAVLIAGLRGDDPVSLLV